MIGLLFSILISQAEPALPPVTSTETPYPTSSSLLHAEELIAKGKKAEALQILEKAYKSSVDPAELREISALIIEASPKHYIKRENHLLYLGRYAKDHPDQVKWYAELGEINFNRKDWDKAEEWYQRALAFSDHKPPFYIQLAKIYYQTNRRELAVKTFIETYAEAKATELSEIRSLIVELWWKIGPLPRGLIQELEKWPEADVQALIKEFFEKAPKDLFPLPLHREMLRQLLQSQVTKPMVMRAFYEGFYFKKNPCFLFDRLLTPADPIYLESLIDCVNMQEKPKAKDLLNFMSQMTDRKDERIDLAESKLLIELGSPDEGILVLLRGGFLRTRSTEFLKHTQKLLLSQPDENFEAIHRKTPNDVWMELLQALPNRALLTKLQALDPDYWYPYEESTYAGRKKPKEFLLRKGVWLASKADTPPESIENLLQEVYTFPLSATEQAVRSQLDELKKLSSTKLPEFYDENFLKARDEWLSKIDRSIAIINGAAPEFRATVFPLLKIAVDQNITEIIRQIDGLRLEGEWKDYSMSFNEKKAFLKEELKQKYNELSASPKEPLAAEPQSE